MGFKDYIRANSGLPASASWADHQRAFYGGTGSLADRKRAFYGGTGSIADREATYLGGTGSLDDRRSAYGGSSPDPLLANWTAAYNARAASPARIAVVGDSISEGQGASAKTNRWMDLLQDSLRAGAVGGVGYVPALYKVFGPDSTWGQWRTSSAGGVNDATNGYATLGYKGYQFDAAGTALWSFTGTDIDIWWVRGGQTFNYQIDGGAAVPVDTAGEYSTAMRTQISGLSAGAHTLRITAVGICLIGGFQVYNGDRTKGVQMIDSTQTGGTLSQFVSGADRFFPALSLAAPDLVILELGGNDAATRQPADVYNDLFYFVGQLQAFPKVPSVLMVAPYGSTTAPLAQPWAQYVTAMGQVATAKNVGFLDLSAQMPIADTSGTGFYSTDGMHPNNSGHVKVASLVLDKLT